MTSTSISDAERREVAARLRKAIGLTEFAEVLGFDWTDDSDWVWNDVSNLVADLIEPSEQEGTCGNCKHFTKDRFMPCAAAHGYTEADVSACEDFSPLSCDRDALLALAREMKRMPQCDLCPAEIVDCSAHPDGCPSALLDYYARRIREACGMVDAG